MRFGAAVEQEIQRRQVGDEMSPKLRVDWYGWAIERQGDSRLRKKAGVGREKMEAAIGRYELEMVEIKEQRQAMETRVAADRLASLHNAMNTLKEEITAAIEAKDAAKNQ